MITNKNICTTFVLIRATCLAVGKIRGKKILHALAGSIKKIFLYLFR
jgi:hypothetical protein